MAWNGEDFQSRRSELLGRVRQRGEQLRQRRRLAWGLTVPAVLLVIAIPAALALNGSDEDRTTVAASGPATSTTSAPPFIDLMPLPLMDPTTTAVAASATPSTTVVRRPTTTSPNSTSSLPPTTIPPTTIPDTTTTTVDDGRPPGPACEASFFEAASTVDKPSYRPGETVTMTATYKNVSGRTCYWASQTMGYDVFDAGGTKVTRGAVGIADAFQWVAFRSGTTHTTRPTWDQKVCGDNGCTGQAPPGTYTIVHRNDPFGTTQATFQLVAG